LFVECEGLPVDGLKLELFLEVAAFGRELVKVAPARLLPTCYAQPAVAMMALQKLDEAEELLHEGLSVGRQKGLWNSHVSLTIDGTASASRKACRG
jgi:hypothetical protein